MDAGELADYEKKDEGESEAPSQEPSDVAEKKSGIRSGSDALAVLVLSDTAVLMIVFGVALCGSGPVTGSRWRTESTEAQRSRRPIDRRDSAFSETLCSLYAHGNQEGYRLFQSPGEGETFGGP
jgi:hypothetical protein